MKRRSLNSLIILLVFTLLVSCKTLRNLSPPEYSIEQLKIAEFYKLSGEYVNELDTVFGKIVTYPPTGSVSNKVLLERLFMYFPERGYKDSVTVTLEFISRKKAVVRAHQNRELFMTKNIHGKMRRGYFYVRPKLMLIPFFPIAYAHFFERIRIGKLHDGIIIDHTERKWGIAIFGGARESGISTAIYKKEK